MRMQPLSSTTRRTFNRLSTVKTITQTKHALRTVLLFVVAALSTTVLASRLSSEGALRQLLNGPKSNAGVEGLSQPQATETTPLLTSSMPQSSSLSVERKGHTATVLGDGRVLVVGGENSNGPIGQSELFDPATATFSASANLSTARAGHSATRLSDGRVLIAGGQGATGALSSSEIFDPATGTFVSGPTMSVARAGHSATLFADGRILIAGGNESSSAEIFDPSTGAFSAVGATLLGARSKHSAALLLDGRVLIVGGRDASGNALSSGEVFDPATGSFSEVAGSLAVARVLPHLRVLFDGKVQIIGGSNDGSMEIYDPSIGTYGAYAHVLPETDTCTGLKPGILSAQTRAALFHNGQADSLLDRSGHTITELNSNQALVVGGTNSSEAQLNSFALLGSSAASISTDKLDYAPGETATISGRGFQPGETVRVKIHEDPHTPQERGFDIVVEADGSFAGTYLVQDYDLSMKFIVSARGLGSGWNAHTTFTDSRTITSATLNNVTSVTVSPGAIISAKVDVTTDNAGGNQNWRSTGWRISTSAPGTVTCFDNANHDGSGSYSETFNITAPAGAGTYNAYFIAYSNDGCTNQPSNTFTLTNGVIVDGANPTVTSINRADASPTNASSVSWTVTFSESVMGVDSSDFALVSTGLTGTPTITGFSGSGASYTVSADTGNGTGTLGLNLNDDDSIVDAAGNKLGGTGTGTAGGGGAGNGSFTGQVYSLNRTLTPAITAANKTYDGNTSATITSRTFTSALTVTDDVSVDGGTANFDTANAGTGKTVTATGLTLAGADASRYILSTSTATTTANINKADAVCSISGYTGTYDAAAHGATGSCTGVDAGGAATGSSLNLGASFTNVPGGTANWSFVGGNNYNDQSDSVAIVINKADATIVVNGYTGTYDGAAHGATGTATGVLSEALAGLDLGASFTNVPGGTANWTFTDVTGNYNNASGTAAIVINKADATIVVNGYTGTYDGAAHGATGTATGVLSEALAGLDLGASFTNVPGGTANWTFTDVTGNYNNASGTAAIVINKADATINVNGYTGVYDGAAHGATGTATGVLSEALAGLDLGASFTNVPGGTANWTFTDVTGNYNNASGTAAIVITKADATIVVNGYTGTYDGAAHGATGTATGVLSEALAGLDLGASFTNVPGGTANWTFTDVTGNYNNASGTAAIVINKADATIVVNGYTGTYDGAAHGATGTATGVLSEALAGLDLGASFTNVPGGTANWTFTDVTGNYNNASGTAAIVINKADATINVTGYTGTYDGAAHGATGTATGVLSEALAGLDLGASFTNVPGGTANWTFTDVTGNYNNASGTAAIVISQAPSTVTVTCPGTAQTYSGGAQMPCTAEATGAGMSPVDVTASLIYGNNINVGTATADASWPGDGNHTGNSGSGSFEISKATLNITAVTNTKPYDANTTAAAIPTVAGLQGSDSVTGLAQVYDNKNVGSGKVLSVSAYTVNDGNGGNNYEVHTFTNSTGVITAVALNITAAANTKVYDGSTSAAAIPTVSGLQGTDTVSALAEIYDTKHKGTGKTLSVSAYTVNDDNGGNNYEVHTFTNNAGVINAAPLTIAAVTNTKVYDGTSSATALPTVTGLQGTDTVSGLAEVYDSKHVGSGKTLSVSAYTVNDGNGGENYNVGTTTNTTGVINQRPITVTALTSTKPYDGNNSSSVIPVVTTGSIAAGDTGNFTETFDTPFVGTGKTLTPAGSVSDGNGGNNYNVTFASVSTGVITTIYCFDGFLSPIGGSVETFNGGSFGDPVRAFKLGSTIPVKFALRSWTGTTCGAAITTGIHTLQAIRYSTVTASDPPIDATPTDAATIGNQFRLTDSQWHFNLSTKGGGFTQGTWLLQATLQDGSIHTVWISLKK